MVMANTVRRWICCVMGWARRVRRLGGGSTGDGWLQQVNSRLHSPDRQPSIGDSAFLFKGIKATWNEVFSHGFGPSVRSLVFEVSDVRNRWAHQQS